MASLLDHTLVTFPVTVCADLLSPLEESSGREFSACSLTLWPSLWQPICVCHTQIRTINKPTLEPYDVFTLKLHKAASADITEWSDAVIFLCFKMKVIKKDTGFGRKDSRAINTGERIILTTGSQGVDCKNRFGLPPEIPAEYDEYHRLISESRRQNASTS